MPPHDATEGFARAFDRLRPADQQRFRDAVVKLVEDLRAIEAGTAARTRPGLRIKKVRARPGHLEMTWAPNGRATFSWGRAEREGLFHVVWHDIGGHEILP